MDFKLVIQLSKLLDLTDQICDSFNDKNYFLQIFIDLSKAFDTVAFDILFHFKKIEHYAIKGRNLSWVQSYLSNKPYATH